MPDLVYASADCAASTNDGIPVTVREGDVWAADDPFVIARPSLFSTEPPGPNFHRRTVAVEDLPTTAPARRRPKVVH